MDTIKTILYGIIIGISNVVPGVSGGTMAVVLNFYDRIISVISLNIQAIKENFRFIFFLGIGIVIGVFGFSRLMGWMMNQFREPTFFAFIGIIVASLPMILHKAQIKKITFPISVAFLVPFILMVSLMLFANEDIGQIDVSILTFNMGVALFLASALGTITMILPGISGALLLLVIGMYQGIYGYVIGGLVFPHILIVGAGMFTGLILGARWVNYGLKNHQQIMYSCIIGLLIGSIFELFPGWQSSIESYGVGILSFGLVFWFNHKHGGLR